jgi:hypothetical protein
MEKAFLFFFMIMSSSAFSQQDTLIRFFANDSAFQISDVNCDAFDSIYEVTLTVPIPEDYENYEIFTIDLGARQELQKISSVTYNRSEIKNIISDQGYISIILFGPEIMISKFYFTTETIKWECQDSGNTENPWEIINVKAGPSSISYYYNDTPVYMGYKSATGKLIIRKV